MVSWWYLVGGQLVVHGYLWWFHIKMTVYNEYWLINILKNDWCWYLDVTIATTIKSRQIHMVLAWWIGGNSGHPTWQPENVRATFGLAVTTCCDCCWNFEATPWVLGIFVVMVLGIPTRLLLLWWVVGIPTQNDQVASSPISCMQHQPIICDCQPWHTIKHQYEPEYPMLVTAKH